MVHKIKWNNYIYSVNKWADHLNNVYPLDDYKIQVSLTGYACERIHIEAGSEKNLRDLNDTVFNDWFYEKDNNLGDIAEAILDKDKLDYEDRRPIKDKCWYRNIFIKDTKTRVAYERWGADKYGNEYSSLVLEKHSVPYIIDQQLIVFAQEDLKSRAIPLMNKRTQLNKEIKSSQKQIDKYKKLIKDHQKRLNKANENIESIKYQLSNKPPK